jgi:GxxExxY protein
MLDAKIQRRKQRELTVQRQKQIPIVYKGMRLAAPLCVDVLVNELVIVECKSAEDFHMIYAVQALTYLRLTNLKLALIINFGKRQVKNGIRRVVNNL